MAAICWLGVPYCSRLHPKKRNHGFRCSSSGGKEKGEETPWVLKIAVSGVTEFLRLFSSANDRFDTVSYIQKAEPSIYSIDDIVVILQSDYANAYFLTGNFTPAIYAKDCTFEDPTIKFRGRDLYARNLKLLVPFFDCPVLILQQIEKGVGSENSVVATWKLRTYLKLPWKPLISIEGSTIYDLDEEFRIIRHAESWNVSALEAVGQIFTPSTGGNVE